MKCANNPDLSNHVYAVSLQGGLVIINFGSKPTLLHFSSVFRMLYQPSETHPGRRRGLVNSFWFETDVVAFFPAVFACFIAF